MRAWAAMFSGILMVGLILILIGISPALQISQDPIKRWGEVQAPVAEDVPHQGTTPGSDGTWVVGRELLPGTYTTTVTERECMWVRLSGFSLSMDDVIAVGRAPQGARPMVKIEKGDKGFESHGCSTWKQVRVS